jgi:hypothetical protein
MAGPVSTVGYAGSAVTVGLASGEGVAVGAAFSSAGVPLAAGAGEPVRIGVGVSGAAVGLADGSGVAVTVAVGVLVGGGTRGGGAMGSVSPGRGQGVVLMVGDTGVMSGWSVS